MESQTMKHSHSILAQLVLPMQANPAGNVHGGEIMKMMDSAAGVAAQKHAHTNVVTARVDELNFKKPVLVGELVTCKAQVIYAGCSSMEVFVTVESEDLITGNKQIALTAFLRWFRLMKTVSRHLYRSLFMMKIMRMRVNYIKSAKKSTFCIMRENLNI